jgi:hypothetical protein
MHFIYVALEGQLRGKFLLVKGVGTIYVAAAL